MDRSMEKWINLYNKRQPVYFQGKTEGHSKRPSEEFDKVYKGLENEKVIKFMFIKIPLGKIKNFLRKIGILFLILSLPALCQAASHLEKDYQDAWCKNHSGITEYVLDDNSRVDCLTKDYAVEFDSASKWAESIGQSLYYALKTGKKPGIVLICEGNCDALISRLRAVADKYQIKVWVIK